MSRAAAAGREKMGKSILIYGDSDTWGFDAKTYLETGDQRSRLGEDERFGGILRKRLPEGYTVIEEGLSGRTTVLSDPLGEYKNGKTYLLPCLLSHAPLDLVVLALGTNDMQHCYHFSPVYSAAGIGELIRIIRNSECGRGGGVPQILVVAPAAFGGGISRSPFADLFDCPELEEKMRRLSVEYAKTAAQYECSFLDASTVARAGDADGVHLDAENHKKLAFALEGKILSILHSKA